jgi:hypothetical protein
MLFNIVYPLPLVNTITGNTLADAIKAHVKLNYELNIRNMIIMDRQRYYEAQMRYYKKNGRNKIAINAYPIPYNALPKELWIRG